MTDVDYLTIRLGASIRDALEQLTHAAAEFSSLKCFPDLGRVMGSVGTLYQLADRPLEARVQYEQALTLFQRIGDHAQTVTTVGNLGLLHENEGSLGQAETYFNEAIEGFADLGDQRGEAMFLVNLVRLLCRQGRQTQAASLYERARDVCIRNDYHDEIERLDRIMNDEQRHVDLSPVDVDPSCSKES